MKNIDFKNHILPHVVAIVIFLVITVAFFNPIFFGNKAMQQTDVLNGMGTGQEIKEYRAQTGEEALWTDALFGGMPAYLINIIYPGEGIVNSLHHIYELFLPRTPSLIFKAMLSFYILLLVFGVRPYLAIAGAIAYGLGTFNMISLVAGHVWKVDAISYIPLVLAGVHATLKGKRIWGFTLTALGLTFEIDSNHIQIAYYLMLIILIYGISAFIYAIRHNELRPFLISAAILTGAAVLALGTNVGRLWNTYQYAKYSIRGNSDLTQTNNQRGSEGLTREYAFNWSIGKWETLTLLVPDFSGGGSGRGLSENSATAGFLNSRNISPQQIQQFMANAPTYWGEKPFTGGPTYAGAIICFLFLLGCFLAPKEHRVWLIVATVLSMILAWGKNFSAFNDFMFDYFPMYNKFRTVEMALVIALLCMPLLGFMGLEQLLEKGFNAETTKKFWMASGISAGILLILIVFAGAWKYASPADQQYASQGMADLVDVLRDDRKSLLRTDAFRSLFFIAAAIGLIYFYVKRKISYLILAPGLGLLILMDLWTVDRRYLDENNYVRVSNKMAFFNPTEADQYINQDTTHYRVLNLQNPWNEGRTSYFHASVGGYHAAKLGRYQDLIDRYLDNEKNAIIQQLQKGSRNFGNVPVLNMLNTKYIIAGSSKNVVFTNPGALGSAWLVSQVRKVTNADEEITALGDLKPAETAVVDASKFPVEQTTYHSQGSIELTSYSPNHLTYQVNATGESFAVFSEVYYPDGWKALIDGKETDYVRADYILRAMPIPAGQHKIEFIFDPASYRVGSTSMLIFSILLLICVIGSIAYTGKEILDTRKS